MLAANIVNITVIYLVYKNNTFIVDSAEERRGGIQRKCNVEYNPRIYVALNI
jgi:hypothetical protein